MSKQQIVKMIEDHIRAWINIKTELIKMGHTDFLCIDARVDTLNNILDEINDKNSASARLQDNV